MRTNRQKQMVKLNEICYEAVVEQVRKGAPFLYIAIMIYVYNVYCIYGDIYNVMYIYIMYILYVDVCF